MRLNIKALPEPKLTDMAETILAARYLIKDEEQHVIETPKQLFVRVAQHIAEAEALHGATEEQVAAKAEEFYHVMADGVFLPNTPTLINAGRPLGMLSACFLLKIEDSMTSIYQALYDSAIIFQRGGGVGYSFSDLRPAGDVVKSTSGTSSGVLSFMRVFNVSTDVVKQAGVRRGAMMGVLNVHHPEILEFISCKRDTRELTNFNLSVAVTDKFMRAVKDNRDYDIINPRTKKVAKRIKAREVFDKLVDNAWATGEPGIVFIDTVNRANPTPELGEIKGSNPCVTGDTRILTDKGYLRIDSVVGKTVNVWNGMEFSAVVPRITGKNQELVEVAFSNGASIKCTPYHGFYVTKHSYSRKKVYKKVQAIDLVIGDVVEEANTQIAFTRATEGRTREFYTAGFFSGDGCYDKTHDKNIIDLYGTKKKLQKFLHIKREVRDSAASASIRVVLEKPTSPAIAEWDKGYVPLTGVATDCQLAWLAGLIDSDGTRNSSDGAVSITSINKAFLENVCLLLSTLGSTYVLGKSHAGRRRKLPNGKGGLKTYLTQDCYRVTVPASSVKKLVDGGLSCRRVNIVCSPTRAATRYITVTSVTKLSEKAEQVYCFTEPKRGRGVFNGILTANCGELFAQPNTSCNLGSINVGKFFDARNNNIDYERLRTVIRTCVDFLDNTIDVNKYPLPAIDAMTKKQRPIGLGMMGFADLLYKWRVPYNTEAGREVASNLIKFFKETALERSIELAGLRGPCPVFAAREKEADAPIARNATLTVLAPTGTISMIAGASGGIEPQFGLVYTKKNVLDGKEFKSINEEFRAALQEHGIEEGKVLEHLEKYGSIKDCALVPDNLKRVFVTAYDIAMDDHVRMQAAFQKYTDSGISKTCNAPRDATRAQIADMFMLAYDLGCKGITVYRDGSRENQILNVGPEPKKEEKKEPAVRTRTRPQITYGATPKLSVGCGSMYMTLNEDAKGLCEIFIQVGKSGGCTASQNEALARIISLALRSDVQVHKIIKELEGIRCPSPCMIEGGSVLSCADAIAKGLKDYSKRRAKEERAEIESERPQLRDDAANAGHNPQCPVCGAMLAFKEGCVACMACGWSRCG